MPHISLVLKNARIYTMDGRIEEAVAVAGDLIVKVGSNKEIEKYIGENTKVLDLTGKTVVPGFNDTHTHLVAYGCAINSVDLENVSSREEVTERIRNFIKKKNIQKGQWVLGRGWNQNFFPDAKFPTKIDLDKASVDNPILIIRTCGHIGIANTMALENVGVTRNSFIAGGEFDKGLDGEPNGVIREASLEWFKRNKKSKQNSYEIKKAIVDGGNELLKYGITTIHTEDSYDLGYGGDFLDIYNAYQELIAEDKLPVRVYQKISLPTGEEVDEFLKGKLRTGMGNKYYHIGPMKQWADGTIGARTAGMREPYSDDKGNTGLYYYTSDELYKNIKKAHLAGMQICIHTIGDGALKMVLDAYEKVLTEFPKKDHRHRLVHCFVGTEELYEKIARLGLNINTQPTSTSTDIPMMRNRMGKEREKYCHAWRTLTDLGVKITASSDIPVETPNVFSGIYAIVTRKNLDDPSIAPWNPHEKVTPLEALRFYTINGAYSAFEDNIKGSVTEGKLADLVVLDRDPCAVEPEELKNVRVLNTILGGKIKYCTE